MKPIKFTVAALLSLLLTNNAYALSLKQEDIGSSLYENRSCEDLYYEISELERATLNYESPLYNSRNTGMATVASTVFTPAVFFVGFANAMTFKSEFESSQNNKYMNDLRHRMAEMRCFSK